MTAAAESEDLAALVDSPVIDEEMALLESAVSGPSVLHGSQTAALTTRVDVLWEVASEVQEVVGEQVVAQVRQILERVRGRLDLGVDRTVVALVGGTGSGKSSLFNAVTRLKFADVGDTRPTTAAPSACVWGPDGEKLLDWMGIDRLRRMQRESLLDGDDEANLAGLVLVDMPDHDSIEAANRAIVDQVMPYSDLVLWVVDPQKYADDALHTGYLRAFVGREETMLVVLNQIDTVPDDTRDDLVADLENLLREDGLIGVTVHAASARTGFGIAQLRERLVDVVARRSSAAVHASDEVESVAQELLAALGAPGRPASAPQIETIVDTLAEAAGLAAFGDAVGSAVRTGTALREHLGSVHEDSAELARSQWLSLVTADLNPAWSRTLETRVSTAGQLRAAVSTVLTALTTGVRDSRWSRSLVVSGVGVGGLGLVVGVTGLLTDVLVAWLGFGMLGVGGAVALLGWWWRRLDAVRATRDVVDRGRQAVREVIETSLVEPANSVLNKQARLRQVVEGTTADAF